MLDQTSIKAEFYDSGISSQHFKLKILSKFDPQNPECKTSEIKFRNKIYS
ncbi:hypothetical protein [uncultured Campylobacter sp.]|nr:hypothetical protein [uncultured Campylobacter sp.]